MYVVLANTNAVQLNIQFSRGNVATHFGGGGKDLNLDLDLLLDVIPEYDGERIIKIGPHLRELWGMYSAETLYTYWNFKRRTVSLQKRGFLSFLTAHNMKTT